MTTVASFRDGTSFAAFSYTQVEESSWQVTLFIGHWEE
jgi:hypothetical protein